MIQASGICALIISWWMPGNKNKVKNDNLKYKHFMNKVPWINGSNSLKGTDDTIVTDENVSKPHFSPLWHDACIHNRPNINSYFFLVQVYRSFPSNKYWHWYIFIQTNLSFCCPSRPQKQMKRMDMIWFSMNFLMESSIYISIEFMKSFCIWTSFTRVIA